MKLKEILQSYTVSSLKEQCSQYGLTRYSKLKKEELAQLLSDTMLREDFLTDFFLSIHQEAFRAFEKLLKGKTVENRSELYPFAEAGYISKGEGDSIEIAEELQKFSYKRFDGAFYKQRKRVQLVRDYNKAFVNLYGILPMEKAIELMQEYEGMTATEFEQTIRTILRTTRQFFYLEGEDLVAEALMLDDADYTEVYTAQVGKPHIHLTKGELLLYANDWYREKTPQGDKMARFLRSRFGISVRGSETIVHDIAGCCEMNSSFEYVLDYIGSEGIHFDEETLLEFMSLYTDLQNHTRTWYNCGYSPAELAALQK